MIRQVIIRDANGNSKAVYDVEHLAMEPAHYELTESDNGETLVLTLTLDEPEEEPEEFEPTEPDWDAIAKERYLDL